MTRNDDGVPDVWLADLAVGAVAERSHSDQAVANDLVSSATAVGPNKGGDTVTTNLSVGAVRLGQVFGSPSDSELIAHVADVAERHGLTVADLQILHPLESALSVKFVVPDGATIDWTIDELRTDLVGKSPDVEGVFIELGDSHGQPLLQAGVAYRTGEGGLWFAPGQDARFGAVHGGTPGNLLRKTRRPPTGRRRAPAAPSGCSPGLRAVLRTRQAAGYRTPVLVAASILTSCTDTYQLFERCASHHRASTVCSPSVKQPVRPYSTYTRAAPT